MTHADDDAPNPLSYRPVGAPRVDPATEYVPPDPPPPAPREVTPRVLRRAWAEKHVRVWWLMGVAVLLVAAYYGTSRAYAWRQESTLIHEGTKVDAKVVSWDPMGKAPLGKVIPVGSMIQLEYKHGGQTYNVYGPLRGRETDVRTGDVVPLFVDPADPLRWTGRTKPGSLGQELVGTMILLPMAALLFAVAIYARRRVLRVYRDGSTVLGEVVGVGHTASAPFSRLVRCAVHVGDDDARVVKVILPPHKAPAVGHPLWLITPANRPDLGIPAALFD